MPCGAGLYYICQPKQKRHPVGAVLFIPPSKLLQFCHIPLGKGGYDRRLTTAPLPKGGCLPQGRLGDIPQKKVADWEDQSAEYRVVG